MCVCEAGAVVDWREQVGMQGSCRVAAAAAEPKHMQASQPASQGLGSTADPWPLTLHPIPPTNPLAATQPTYLPTGTRPQSPGLGFPGQTAPSSSPQRPPTHPLAATHPPNPPPTSRGKLDSQRRAAAPRCPGRESSRQSGVAARSAASQPLHTSPRPCTVGGWGAMPCCWYVGSGRQLMYAHATHSHTTPTCHAPQSPPPCCAAPAAAHPTTDKQGYKSTSATCHARTMSSRLLCCSSSRRKMSPSSA